MERVQGEVDVLTARFTLLPDTQEVIENWLELVTQHDVKGKQVHDARLVAAMQTYNVDSLLTLNIKFERYSEIEAVHPSSVEER